jgi:hypothetical protein
VGLVAERKKTPQPLAHYPKSQMLTDTASSSVEYFVLHTEVLASQGPEDTFTQDDTTRVTLCADIGRVPFHATRVQLLMIQKISCA